MDPIMAVCNRYGVTVIEDAAEALGATYKGRAPGEPGLGRHLLLQRQQDHHDLGGGMVVSADKVFIDHAWKLATQARDPVPHYEHSEIGYNYRMSNVLAAIGRGQLEVLEERVQARHRNFAYYQQTLGDLPGIAFMPEAPWGQSTRWLTVITVDSNRFGADREAVRLGLEAENIEARPVWKPMHLQPIFADHEYVGGSVAADLFDRGLCLPSGSSLTETDLARVARSVRGIASGKL